MKPRSVGQLVIEYVRLAGGSGNKAAKRLGISQTVVADWIKGKDLPSGTRLKQMADELGVPAEYALSLLALERAPAELKPVWQRILSHMGVLTLALGAATFFAPPPAYAGFDISVFARPFNGRTTHCMPFLRRVLAWLRGWL